MNIIIVGDGKVGYTLAEYLSKEDHDVTLVDRNQQALDKATETLDVMGVKGNGANVRTLLEAGADEADILIAVTTHDETNMVCCLAAKQLGAKYTIARIRDPEYTESISLLQNGMGIDLVVNPERASAMEISRLLRFPFATNIEAFAHGRVEMVEFKAMEGDPIVNTPIRSLPSRIPRVLYCVVQRDHDTFIPNGDTIIRPGDRVHVAADLITITQFFKYMGKNTQKVRSAMLLGGGHIAFYLARIIAGMGIKLSIVELKPETCAMLSEMLDEVTVIQGDGTDQELLDSENMREMGALICLTGRDEENLITGLYGAKCGVGKVIVKVNRLNYMDVMHDMGIDSVVSPKLTTANLILRSVRARSRSQDSVLEKVYRILGGEVEVCEFTALEGAPFLNVPLSQLSIAPGVLVAVLVRGKKIIIPFGNDHIESGDTVILVSRASKIVTLEDAFR